MLYRPPANVEALPLFPALHPFPAPPNKSPPEVAFSPIPLVPAFPPAVCEPPPGIALVDL